MVILGLGAGLSFVSITTAALVRVDEEAAGLASGLLSTSGQLGGALGVAALASIVTARTSDLLDTGSGPLAAEVGGLHLAFLLAGAVSLTASLIAALALRRAPDEPAVRAPTAFPPWWMTGFSTAPPSGGLAVALEEARAIVRSFLTEAEEHAWHGLLETQAAVVRTLNERLLAEHGLSYTELDALMHIGHAEDGAVRPGDLARRTGVREADARRTLADLDDKGLLEMRDDVPAVTEAGRARLREAAPSYLATIRTRFFDPLDDRDVKRLGRICERVQAGTAGSP